MGVSLQKKGNRWKGPCPFHEDNDPSFIVYPDGGFYCFGCGKTGTIESFSSTSRLLRNKEYVANKLDVENSNFDHKREYMTFRNNIEKYLYKKTRGLTNIALLLVYDKFDVLMMGARSLKEVRNTIQFNTKIKKTIDTLVLEHT